MPGYSGTPLAKKLGIKEGHRVLIGNEPKGFRSELEGLPDGVTFVKSGKALDVVMLFVTSRAELTKALAAAQKSIQPDGMIWVAWPKKASKVPTDLTEDALREVGLPMGIVDIKVCAVTDIWSGLKFVIRKENRAATNRA